jgi:hypothetical protein
MVKEWPKRGSIDDEYLKPTQEVNIETFQSNEPFSTEPQRVEIEIISKPTEEEIP